MKIAKNWLKIIIICLGHTSLFADNMIVLYLQHAPEEVRRDVEEEYKNSRNVQKFAPFENQTPAQMSQKLIKNSIRTILTPSLSGFLVLYGGYMDVSNQDGLVTFPLRHSEPQLLIAVTPEIKLVRVKGHTFSHAEYLDEKQTKLYLLEKKEDEKSQTYWEISEAQLPEDKKIDPTTIVILSKPKNIFIPEGSFITGRNNQMITPEIYVIGNTEKEAVLLKALEIKKYFEPIELEEKPISDTAVQKLIKNL